VRTKPPPLFSIRLVALWLAAAALACAFSFFLMTRDTTGENRPDEAGPTIFSRSAIGYGAFYHTLRTLGVSVAESTAAVPSGAALVVIAEPNRDERTLAHVRDVIARAPSVLLILPKRKGRPDPERPWFLRYDELLPAREVQRVLDTAGAQATVDRGEERGAWRTIAPIENAPSIGDAQLVRSPPLEPFLDAPGGVLIGEFVRGGRRVAVLADPDLAENHGLVRGDNAAIAVALVRSLRGEGGGRVVFDEAVHGYISRPFGFAQLLFGFPFVLVTAQLALAAALLVWSAAGRFGAPKPREPALPAGKRTLIESGARLFELADHAQYLADRYADAVVRETARRLQAPRGLTRAQLAAWFTEAGRPLPAAPAAAGASGAVDRAYAMHAWRRVALDESGRRTQHRRLAED
jgi:hypothetical protein